MSRQQIHLSLRQQLILIAIAMVAGVLVGIPTREDILNKIGPNPNDFTALFLTIFETAALIDFLDSWPVFGLFVIGVASRSYGAVVGVIVLDHRNFPIVSLISLSMTGAFEVTAQVMAGLGGFRLLESAGPEDRRAPVLTYLKLLGLSLSISCASTLFETASILGILPFGL